MPQPKSGSSSAPAGKPSRTAKLDAELVERYHRDPAAFRRATQQNLYVIVALLVFAAILAYASFKLVGLSAGGLALLTIAIFPVLLALAAYDDVRWRKALDARQGVPPLPPPPLTRFLSRAPRAKKAVGGSASTAPSSTSERTAGSA